MSTSRSTTTAENDSPVRMPNGNYGVLLVSGQSNYEDRQNLASCILSTLTDVPDTPAHEYSQTHAWTVAYLVAVAKALLDSMRLEDRGGAA